MVAIDFHRGIQPVRTCLVHSAPRPDIESARVVRVERTPWDSRSDSRSGVTPRYGRLQKVTSKWLISKKKGRERAGLGGIGRMHRDIKPSNVLIDQDGRTVSPTLACAAGPGCGARGFSVQPYCSPSWRSLAGPSDRLPPRYAGALLTSSPVSGTAPSRRKYARRSRP